MENDGEDDDADEEDDDHDDNDCDNEAGCKDDNGCEGQGKNEDKEWVIVGNLHWTIFIPKIC